MSYVTAQVYYTAACPCCKEDAQWHGVNVAEKVPLDVHSTQEYYEDHLQLYVRCRGCDAKDMKWTAA